MSRFWNSVMSAMRSRINISTQATPWNPVFVQATPWNLVSVQGSVRIGRQAVITTPVITMSLLKRVHQLQDEFSVQGPVFGRRRELNRLCLILVQFLDTAS